MNGSQRQHFSKLTCSGTFSQRGVYRLSHGRGRYARIRGHGRYVLHGLLVTRHTAHGSRLTAAGIGRSPSTQSLRPKARQQCCRNSRQLCPSPATRAPWLVRGYLRERKMMPNILRLMRAKRQSCHGMNVRMKSVQRVGRVT